MLHHKYFNISLGKSPRNRITETKDMNILKIYIHIAKALSQHMFILSDSECKTVLILPI